VIDRHGNLTTKSTGSGLPPRRIQSAYNQKFMSQQRADLKEAENFGNSVESDAVAQFLEPEIIRRDYKSTQNA
jgi:hypothetical protein